MEEYLKKRGKFIPENRLSFEEKRVNTFLKSKLDDINIKKIIRMEQEKTDVIKYFKLMPKGCNLHTHFSAIVSYKKILKIVLESKKFREQLYILLKPEIKVCSYPIRQECLYELQFFEIKPPGRWRLLKNHKNKIENIFNLIKHKPKNVLERLGEIFYGIIRYKAFYPRYWELIFEEMEYDSIDHMEIKLRLGTVYYYQNSKKMYLSMEEEVELIKEIQKKTDKSFVIIPTFSRSSKVSKLDNYLSIVYTLKKKYPDLIAGFDLVGDETKGKRNIDFMEILLKYKMKAKKEEVNFPYFLHSGENTKINDPIDENMLDAILLGSKRIGHGINVWKYPALVELIKKNKIALEICPISNFILYNVHLTNHPAVLLHKLVDITISSDDGNKFGYTHLLYDFLCAFKYFNWTIDDIKKVVLNSIKHSNSKNKGKLEKNFQKKWDKWIQYLLKKLNDT